jgi:hypothetical protein
MLLQQRDWQSQRRSISNPKKNGIATMNAFHIQGRYPELLPPPPAAPAA